MRSDAEERINQRVMTTASGEEEAMDYWDECDAVERVPGKVSGALVFRNTRVPVAALFENLKSGATVDEFIELFPGVSRDQVEVLLEFEASVVNRPMAS